MIIYNLKFTGTFEESPHPILQFLKDAATSVAMELNEDPYVCIKNYLTHGHGLVPR